MVCLIDVRLQAAGTSSISSTEKSLRKASTVKREMEMLDDDTRLEQDVK